MIEDHAIVDTQFLEEQSVEDREIIYKSVPLKGTLSALK